MKPSPLVPCPHGCDMGSIPPSVSQTKELTRCDWCGCARRMVLDAELEEVLRAR